MPDILDEYLKPSGSGSIPAQEALPNASSGADPLDIYLKPSKETKANGPFSVKQAIMNTGIPYGITHGLSNILSSGGQAAATEQGMEGVPGTEETFNILQKNVTGELPQGNVWGRNFGEILPYAATFPSAAGIFPRLINSGVQSAGSTLAGLATAGTPYQPAAELAGGLIAPYAASKALGATGTAAANITGGLSGISEAPVKKAFTTGVEGGAAGETFRASQAGNITPQQLVDEATKALTNMRLARSQQYQSSMANLSKDSTVLSFNDIDKAMDKANKISTFKGQNIKPETQDVQDQVGKIINDWKNLNPLDYHTPSGMDALKQRIGSLKDSLPFNTPQRKVAEDAYSAVRGTIVKQAPDYGKTMSGYEDASDQIDEIRKTLSINPKASVDTSFRKLLSTMRDNVNTNYGQRVSLVQELEKNGAPNLSAALAGQSMRSWMPRGLASGVPALEVPAAAYAAYEGSGLKGLAALTALAPFQSPRALGVMSHTAGRLYGGLGLPSLGEPMSAAPFALNKLSSISQPQ